MDMANSKSFSYSLSVLSLITLSPFWAPAEAWAQAIRCEQLFFKSEHWGLPNDSRVDWNSTVSLLRALQQSESLGLVGYQFSKAWDTAVYWTKTAIPQKGRVPLVDPDSRAVFLFIHGSGTMKSSGKNFIANMNQVAKLGYSAVSIDLPFHAAGPRHPKYNDSFTFMEWLKAIVMELKKSGKPVYLAGHSFGPDVIFEFVTRYPKLVDGVVGLSPASFTKELERWYEQYTSKMSFGGDVASNDAGGQWAYQVSRGFLWSKGRLPDPTLVNPNLKMRILSGNMEEYVPAPLDPQTLKLLGPNTYDISVPLRQRFQKAEITIEPGIGHYLFEHRDAQGNNVVLRELLAIDGVTMSKDNLKKMIDTTSDGKSKYSASLQLLRRYHQDPLFATWLQQQMPTRHIENYLRLLDEARAKKIEISYQEALEARFKEIGAEIMKYAEAHPEFAARFEKQLQEAKKKGYDQALFFPYLQEVLSKNPESVR